MTVQIINFKTDTPVGTIDADGTLLTDDDSLEAAVADLHDDDGAVPFSGMYEQDDGTIYYFSDALAPTDAGYRLVVSRQLPSPYRIPSDQERGLSEPEYIPRPDFTEASVAKEAGAWEPYDGPQGGQGWRNTATDEVRYQEDPPGETAGADESADGPITAEEANNDPQKWVAVTEETYAVFADAEWSGDDALTAHVGDLFQRGFNSDQLNALIDHGYDALSDASVDQDQLYRDGVTEGFDAASPDAHPYRGKLSLAGVDARFKTNFNRHLRDDFGQGIWEVANSVGAEWADSVASTLKKETYPLYRAALDQYTNEYLPRGNTSEYSLMASLYTGDTDTDDYYLRQYRTRMREVYEIAFGDTVPVFRGIAPEDYNDAETVHDRLADDPESVAVEQTVLNSWTTNPMTAEQFASREGKNGLILRQEVPIEHVWMTSDTMPGLYSTEAEFVVGNPRRKQHFDPDDIIVADDFDAVEQANWALDCIGATDAEKADPAAEPGDVVVTIDWEQASHGWLHRLRDDTDTDTDTDTETDADADVAKVETWERYHGPQGGQGWRHRGTGEIRYQQSRPTDGRQHHVEGMGTGMAWTSYDPNGQATVQQPETANHDRTEDATDELETKITWATVSEGDVIAYRDSWSDDIETGEVTAVEPDLQNPGQQVVWVSPDELETDTKRPVYEDQFEGSGAGLYRPLPLDPVPTDFETFTDGQRIVVDNELVGAGFREGLHTATILDVDYGLSENGRRETVIDIELENGRRTEIWEIDHRNDDSGLRIEGVLPDDDFAVKWEVEAAPDPQPHIGAERDSLGAKRSVGNGIPSAWKRIQDEAETGRLEQYLYRRIDALRDDHDHYTDYTDDDRIVNSDGVCRTIQGILAVREDSDIDPTDVTPISYEWGLNDDQKAALADPDEVRDDFDRTLGKLDDHVAAHMLANTASIRIGPTDHDDGDAIGVYEGVHRDITVERAKLNHGTSTLDPSVTAHELGHSIHYMLGMDHGTGHDNRWTDPEDWEWKFRPMHDVTDESQTLYDALRDEWDEMVERERQEASTEIFMPDRELNNKLRHYQTKNGNEFFAVAFAYWVSDYAKLEGRMPGVAKLFDDYLGGGRDPVEPDALDDSHIGRTIIFESADNGYGVPIDVDDPDDHIFKQVAEIKGFEDVEAQDGGDFEILGGRHVRLEYGYKEYTVPIETMQNIQVVP